MAIGYISWGRHAILGEYRGSFQSQNRHLVLKNGSEVHYEPRGRYVPSSISPSAVDAFLLWKALGCPRDMVEQDINLKVTLDQMRQAERS